MPQKTAVPIALVTATNPLGPRGGITRDVGESRDFHLHVTDGELDDPKQYTCIRAQCIACGGRVRIFADSLADKRGVSDSQLTELVTLIEEDVLPRVESQLGPLRDIDQDGRFAVLLTPWLSRLQGGRTSIGGMVRSSDFRRDVPPPLSNRCDMLYLNSSLPTGAALRDLLSHEIAHAACISQRVSPGGSTFHDEEDWLSEALAHSAEPGWSNLDYRLATFLDDSAQFPLVVPDYYRARLWRNAGCRGATYLFLRWCEDRYGTDLIRRLAQSKQRGVRNIENALGSRFEKLFREWSLELADGRALAASDLHDVLSKIGFDRVRPVKWTNEEHKRTVRIRGSGFAVVEFRTDHQPQILRIAGESNAKWQFSICQLPDESPGQLNDNMLAINGR